MVPMPWSRIPTRGRIVDGRSGRLPTRCSSFPEHAGKFAEASATNFQPTGKLPAHRSSFPEEAGKLPTNTSSLPRLRDPSVSRRMLKRISTAVH